MQSKFAHPKNRLSGFLYVGFLTLFSFALYPEIFTYNTFGPETPLFYIANEGLSFSQMLQTYANVSWMWYRPTAFALPYWTLEQFWGWHNLVAWKFAHFWTGLAAAYAIYWLVVRCLGGSRMAGLLSATYFMAQPSLYAAMMEAAGFDFLHILLVVLCVGFYVLGTRETGRRCAVFTVVSWLCFLLALTAKEMALATPGFLLLASALLLWFDRESGPVRVRARRELLRLLPFLANCRKFPLWIVHIYAWSDQTLQIKMYQSTLLNNLAGAAMLLLVAVQWRRMLRTEPTSRPVLWLMLAWTGTYLLLPIYSGGFLWHINLALVGYCVIFGVAIAGLLKAIQPATGRRLAAAGLFLGWLFLSRQDLKIELYAGSHATGYRINHSVIQRPPVAAAAMGSAPLIYIEDRLGMGPWWYGCFGNLFKFAYQRKDLEEVVVPLMPSVSAEERKKWLVRPNAFFFRYDENYDWHDASDEFRAASQQPGELQPGEGCRAGLPTGGKWPIRIAAGRATRLIHNGETWEPDAAYNGGKTYASSKPIAGAELPALYQSERFQEGPFEYRFCVPNGAYTVRLKFAEIWFDTAGKRIFDVAVNGSTVLSKFDVAVAANGSSRAVDRDFRISVGDGRLVIQFRPIVSNPKISAIEITPAG
jgi:hypothetical protein